MSVRLTTPTARPASSITGAALKPRSVSSVTASRTLAMSGMETGFAVIRSAAVFPHRCGGEIVFATSSISFMAFLFSCQGERGQQHLHDGPLDKFVGGAAPQESRLRSDHRCSTALTPSKHSARE